MSTDQDFARRRRAAALRRRRYRRRRILLLIILVLILAGIIFLLAKLFTSCGATPASPSASLAPSPTVSAMSSASPATASISPAASATALPAASTADVLARLDTAAFVGNSYVEDLFLHDAVGNADCIYRMGVMVNNFDTLTPLNSDQLLIDIVEDGNYENIILVFGENELAWPEIGSFIAAYKELVGEIQQRQPNATIYVQAQLPMTAEQSDANLAEGSLENNDQIAKYNDAMRDMAAQLGIGFLEIPPAMQDENGCLPAGAAIDGIHPGREYNQAWGRYVAEHIA